MVLPTGVKSCFSGKSSVEPPSSDTNQDTSDALDLHRQQKHLHYMQCTYIRTYTCTHTHTHCYSSLYKVLVLRTYSSTAFSSQPSLSISGQSSKHRNLPQSKRLQKGTQCYIRTYRYKLEANLSSLLSAVTTGVERGLLFLHVRTYVCLYMQL